MAEYDKLKGLVGQSLGGGIKNATAPMTPYCLTVPLNGSFAAGSSGTWIVPYSGSYRFVMWGGGSGAYNPSSLAGASGAHVQAERALTAGQAVSYIVGGGGGSGGSGSDTTVTLPSGEVIRAGGAVGGTTAGVAHTGGVPTGKIGDILISGTDGRTAAGNGPPGGGNNGGAGGLAGSGQGGSGAPGWGGHKGGGHTSSFQPGGHPGAGGSSDASSGANGGSGDLIIYRVA